MIRASITNGLNGGTNDASVTHAPSPPPRATMAVRYPAIATRLSGNDSVWRSSGRLTNEPIAA